MMILAIPFCLNVRHCRCWLKAVWEAFLIGVLGVFRLPDGYFAWGSSNVSICRSFLCSPPGRTLQLPSCGAGCWILELNR